MSTGRIFGIVAGSLLLLFGLGLIFGGSGVLIAERVLADPTGFVSLRSTPIDQDAHAVVLPVWIDGPQWFWDDDAVTLRLEVAGRGAEAKGLFVGLADRVDVNRYLSGSQYVEVKNYRFSQEGVARRSRLDVTVVAGSAVPAAPTTKAIWIESASGAGAQEIAWRVEPGDYALVLMNADGSRGIAATASIGVRAPFVLTVAWIVLGVGIGFAMFGLAIILISARRRGTASGEAGAAGGTAAGGMAAGGAAASGSAAGFPLTFHAEYTEAVSPALWLVKWFLLIPHFVILGFLWAGFSCSWLVSFFAILFTGRYPRGLFDYNVGVLRWSWRVGFYGYQALATDKYPPFSFQAGGYPADLDIPYPQKLSRRLALVKWWLLAIPHYLIVGLLFAVGPHFGGIVIVLTAIAAVILLFSSRYPRELFQILVGANRWAYRVLAYASLMTDTYPPFRLEE